MKFSLALALLALRAPLSLASCTRRTSTSSKPVSKMDSSTSKLSQSASDGTVPLATWIWDTTFITRPSETSQFFSFAAKQGLQRVFLHVDADIPNSVFEDFIQKCTASGIIVDALIGNAEWIVGSHLGRPNLGANLRWIDQYQGNASADARFTELHMDIELWALDGWSSMLNTYVPAWQNLVIEITSFARSMGMPTAADLPFWAYDMFDPTTGESMDSWMLRALDSVTFMTYRNTVGQLMSVAEKPLRAADAAGKRAYVSVETVASREATVSFKGLATVMSLSKKLQSITTRCSGHSSFAGVAIHDYNGWLALG